MNHTSPEGQLTNFGLSEKTKDYPAGGAREPSARKNGALIQDCFGG